MQRCEALDKLQSLTTVLFEIDATSRKILKATVSILPSAKAPTKSMMSTLLTSCPTLKMSSLTALFESTLLEIVEDAEKTQDELERFVQDIASNNTVSDNTLLGNVWYGDAYDAQGEEGLQRLLVDLKSTLQQIEKRGTQFLTERAVRRAKASRASH